MVGEYSYIIIDVIICINKSHSNEDITTND